MPLKLSLEIPDDPIGQAGQPSQPSRQEPTSASSPKAGSGLPQNPMPAAPSPSSPPASRPYLVLDIETRPADNLDELLTLEGLNAEPTLPEPPDLAAIKAPANIKDPAKQAAAIEERKARAMAEHAADCFKAREEHQTKKTKFVEKAALSPLTGCVVAIGWREVGVDGAVGPVNTIVNQNETEVLDAFLGIVKGRPRLVGHNVRDFDLPFLIRRLWAVGAAVPYDYLTDRATALDTMLHATCNVRGERISLGNLCRLLSIPGKNGDGAEFHKLVAAGALEQAHAYLANDIEITWMAAVRTGLLPEPPAAAQPSPTENESETPHA